MKHVLKKIMKFLLKIILAISLLVGVVWLMKQIEEYNKPKKEIVMQGTVTIKLNESLEAYKNRMGKILNIDNHPAGVSWYEINYDYENKEHRKNTHVLLEVGDSVLKFDYPLQSMISVFELPRVSSISLSLGLTSEKSPTNELAKEKMYEILEQIVDAGWKRYIDGSAVRLCGKEAFRVQKDHSILMKPYLDVNYFMNFEEWFSINTYHWEFFYKNEALMDVSLHKEHSGNDPHAQSGYFLSIDVKSVEEDLRSNFKPEERNNWRELWLKELPRYHQFRVKAEAEAVAKGYHICTKHEDAPFDNGILPPQSKEEEQNSTQKEKTLIIRSGELCPKSGLWMAVLPPSHPKAKLIQHSNAHTMHCAKGTHILKFGLSSEYEADIRWVFLSEEQERYNPNK